MNKSQKILYYLVIVIFIVSGIGLGTYYFAYGNKAPLFLGLGTPLFLFIPFAFYKCNIKIPYRLLTFFFIFLIMGYNIGFIMDGYKRFIFYYCDKIVHFTSGFLFTTIGLCIFFYFLSQCDGKKNRRNMQFAHTASCKKRLAFISAACYNE